MARPRVVFLGSPAFAVPSLQAACAVAEVPLVLTQPDRPSGRGRRLQPTAVRQAATDLGLPVRAYVPRERREVVAQLQGLDVDVLLVVAFGHILKPSMLASARCGAVNVHASLLPRWRGVSPVEQALLAGDTETGVTLMQLDEGVDTGPILAQRRVPIEAATTRVDLLQTLAAEGAALVRGALLAFLDGALRPQPQPQEGACYAPRLDKDQGRLDWTADAAGLERQVRALFGWPGCFTQLPQAHAPSVTLKVHRARLAEAAPGAPPGTLLEVAEPRVVVACGRGALELLEVQWPGGRRAEAGALRRAGRLLPGLRFDTAEAAP